MSRFPHISKPYFQRMDPQREICVDIWRWGSIRWQPQLEQSCSMGFWASKPGPSMDYYKSVAVYLLMFEDSSWAVPNNKGMVRLKISQGQESEKSLI